MTDLDIDGSLIQSQVADFLADLDTLIPGIRSRAITSETGDVLAFRGHWLPQSHSKGSYTCYLPGQFTEVAGLESESAEGLKFAGEHADSFYNWQGYMEGAAASGHAAADEILGDIKAGRLQGAHAPPPGATLEPHARTPCTSITRAAPPAAPGSSPRPSAPGVGAPPAARPSG